MVKIWRLSVEDSNNGVERHVPTARPVDHTRQTLIYIFREHLLLKVVLCPSVALANFFFLCKNQQFFGTNSAIKTQKNAIKTSSFFKKHFLIFIDLKFLEFVF